MPNGTDYSPGNPANLPPRTIREKILNGVAPAYRHGARGIEKILGTKNLQRVRRANPNILGRTNRYVLPAICRQFAAMSTRRPSRSRLNSNEQA